MDYQSLVAEHAAIQQAADALVLLTMSARPKPEAASQLLEHLAELVRDHLSHEDPVIYATADAVRGGRHAVAASASFEAFDALKDDWSQYLYRWDRERVAKNWADFAKDSAAMLGRLKERVEQETAILYSLAIHHRVLAPGT